ncbi:SCAMP like protein [Aduncisulcus paluster]|uniref:SCAMP like protein n=1 Tax=Aduncisulcus paluster TaxID=2918883 RepID=A0ABQ5KJR9_9EUKA|nr:SCAMP like protein [Aduncisulcus paluster]
MTPQPPPPPPPKRNIGSTSHTAPNPLPPLEGSLSLPPPVPHSSPPPIPRSIPPSASRTRSTTPVPHASYSHTPSSPPPIPRSEFPPSNRAHPAHDAGYVDDRVPPPPPSKKGLDRYKQYVEDQITDAAVSAVKSHIRETVAPTGPRRDQKFIPPSVGSSFAGKMTSWGDQLNPNETRFMPASVREKYDSMGPDAPNFPPCCPMTRVDIARDIPEQFQGTVKFAYWCVWLVCLSFLGNLIGYILTIFSSFEELSIIEGFMKNFSNILLAIPLYIIAAFLGTYTAFKKGSRAANNVAILFQIVFFVILGMDAVGLKYCGFLMMLSAFKSGNGLIGVICIICFALLLPVLLFTFFVLKDLLSYRKFLKEQAAEEKKTKGSILSRARKTFA